MTEIFATWGPGDVHAAAIRDGRLIDYAIERPSTVAVGDVWGARVTRRMPAMAGAFVTLGDGIDAFLPDSAGGRDSTEGDFLAVQVTRAPQGGKGPRVARAAQPASATVLGRLARGPGAIQRLATLHPKAYVFVDDHALAADLHDQLGERLRLGAWGSELDDLAATLADPDVPLPGGQRLRIQPTATLVAIDADLGTAAAAGRSKTRTHQQANEMMLPEIARQIRLRNLGGPIVVDLAGLSPARRSALAPAFASALADDPLRPKWLGFTALGLAEILRPRVHPPLHELLLGPVAAGLRAARVALRQTLARPSAALVLRAGRAAAVALQADTAALDGFARRSGLALRIVIDATLPPCGWQLEDV